MTISPASLTEVAPAGGPGGVAFHRTRILQLPRSPKVIAGLVILGFFAVVALLGRWAAPYSPNATDPKNWVQHVLVDGTGPGTSFPANYYPLPYAPSAAHWLRAHGLVRAAPLPGPCF